MRSFSINVASAGDIHLGHPRTPCKHIVANLDKAFADNVATAELDIIFFNGDVFDRLLQVPEDDAYTARAWAWRFLCTCEKHGIAVRVLEGTPRHDRRQSKMFEEVIALTGLQVDFRYVSVLSIEYIERLGVSVLYVPDEWRHESSDTLQEVKALLAANGIAQVDFAIMHGFFEYQMPDVESAKRAAHSAEEYLQLVRHQIFISHVHTFSQYQHIVAPGSFDRLAHNEEAPKGHVRLSIKGEDKTLTFVENAGAMEYRTLNIMDLSMLQVRELIQSLNLPEGSHVRLFGRRTDEGIGGFRHLRKDFPMYRITPKTEKSKRPEAVTANVSRTYVPVQISANNVAGMVRDWLRRAGASDTHIHECEAYLNEQVHPHIGQSRSGAVSDLHGVLVGD